MPEDTKLTVLTMTAREYEAQLIVDALLEKGVHAEISGSATSDFKVGIPGQVEVLVDTAQLESANAAYDKIRDEADHIDWSQVDVGDPED
ncbi:MAG: hypothetical protein KDA93_17695 [Planctomycetaceae bacterium]|nr:hypothetical protein [Planctomycetaceae bacterium]